MSNIRIGVADEDADTVLSYRRQDLAGQTWQSGDEKYLEAWIAGRNSALAEQVPRLVSTTESTSGSTPSGLAVEGRTPS